MTIDKAIEILQEDLNHLQEERSPAVNGALKLGIEALNRLKVLRLVINVPYTDLLPGETKD
jgi:hypothetical protein